MTTKQKIAGIGGALLVGVTSYMASWKKTTYTTATLAWSASYPTNSYDLYYGTSTNYVAKVTTSQLQYKLLNLKVGTIYYFAVSNQCGKTPDLAWKAITWPTSAPAPIALAW